MRREKEIHDGPEWSVVPRSGALEPSKVRRAPMRRWGKAAASKIVSI